MEPESTHHYDQRRYLQHNVFTVHFGQLKKGTDLKVHSLFCENFYFFHLEFCTYTSENSSFPTEQSGQRKSYGTSSQAVPGAIPSSGTPTSGSYSHPQTSHTYFTIVFVLQIIDILHGTTPCSQLEFAALLLAGRLSPYRISIIIALVSRLPWRYHLDSAWLVA